MRISKKYRLTAAAMLAASAVVTVAPDLSHANSMYKDVSPSASYYKDLVELVNQGIISGYADQTFKPDVAVTRGHFAQMLAQLLKLETSKLEDPYLSDVTPSNPFYKYIAALAGAGVDVAYEDGSFKPNQAITRIEAAQLLADALGLKPTAGSANYTDVPAKNQAAVKAIVQNGLMKAPSSKTFNSNGNISRAESVSLLTGIQAFQQDEGTFTFNSLTSAGQVSTSEGTYRLSAEMKKIFNSSNAAALAGAQIKAVISNKQIIKVTGITFNQSGSTYGSTTFNADGAKIEGNVFINADYLRLQNVKINGNVIVNDDAYYNLTLDNVTVKQSVVIEDGYSNSFTFAANNSTIPQLYVKRNNTLVNTDQKITAIVIEGDAKNVALNTKVGKVTIAAGMYPTITGYATIDEMIVERDANVDLRVNGTLAKLEIVHGDSRIYSNRNLLISDVLIPRGSEYTTIIANYSIVNGYIMSVKRPDSTNNLLGINKVPNIPDGVLHPSDGGGDGSNTAIKFDQAVARAVASFSAVPNGKSVTLTARFNSLNNIVKTALGEAQYDYRIRSTTPLTETAKYTLEIKNGTNTYTATVTGKQLNDGIKLEYLILKALGQATNMSGATDTWTISVKILNGTLDLRADLLIKDTVAKSAVFALTGTDTNAGEGGGDKPGAGDDDKPGTGEGDKPGTGGGDKPDTGDGDKPGTGGGDKPGTGGGDKPGTGEGDKPGSGSGGSQTEDKENPDGSVGGPGLETKPEVKDIATTLENYKVTGENNVLTIISKFETMKSDFITAHGSKPYNYIIKALPNVTNDYKVNIKNSNDEVVASDVTIKAKNLNEGIPLSALISATKMGSIKDLSGKTDTWKIEFQELDTEIGLSVDLTADEKVVRTQKSSIKGTFEYALSEAIKGFTADSPVTEGNKIEGKITFGKMMPDLLKDAQLQAFITVDEESLEDLPTNKQFSLKIIENNPENPVSISMTVGSLRNGTPFLDLGKISGIDENSTYDWSIEFEGLDRPLKTTVDLRYVLNKEAKAIEGKSQSVDLIKALDATLINAAKDSVRFFALGDFSEDEKGLVSESTQSTSPTLKITTSFNDKVSGLPEEGTLVDYKIKRSSISDTVFVDDKYYTISIKNVNENKVATGIKVKGKQLTEGVFLSELLKDTQSVNLSKYADLAPKVDGEGENQTTTYLKDQWEITFNDITTITRFDVELAADTYVLTNEKNNYDKYRKYIEINNSISSMLITGIKNAIKPFNVSASGNMITINPVVVDVNGMEQNVKEVDVDFKLKIPNFLYDDSKYTNKDVILNLVDKDGKVISTKKVYLKDLVDGTVRVFEKFEIQGGVVKLSELKDVLSNNQIQIVFDNLNMAQTLEVSLIFNSSNNKQNLTKGYISESKTVVLNPNNTAELIKEIDMAIHKFNAEVNNSSLNNELKVETTFNANGISPDGKQLINIEALKGVNLDAHLKLVGNWAHTNLYYPITDLKINSIPNADLKLGTPTNPLYIKDLINGIKLSEILGGAGNLAGHIQSSGYPQVWKLQSDAFKFATKAEVSLLATGIADVNVATNGEFVINKRSVDFNDNNKFNNYEGAINVNTIGNTIDVSFDHAVPTDLIIDPTLKKASSEYADEVEKILERLFGNSFADVKDAINYNNINMTIKDGKVKNKDKDGKEFEANLKNTLSITFGDEIIKTKVNNTAHSQKPSEDTLRLENEKEGKFGYHLIKLELAKAPTAENTRYLKLTNDLPKNVSVKHDYEWNDGSGNNVSESISFNQQLNLYKAKFINKDEFEKFEGYQKAFDGFDVTFTSTEKNDSVAATNILEVTTKFSDTSTEAIKSRGLDAKIKLGNGTINNADEFKIYIKFQSNGGSKTLLNESNEKPFTVKGAQLKQGVNLSKILGKEVLPEIQSHANGRIDNWEIEVISPVEGKYSAIISLVSYELENGKPKSGAEDVISSVVKEVNLKKNLEK